MIIKIIKFDSCKSKVCFKASFIILIKLASTLKLLLGNNLKGGSSEGGAGVLQQQLKDNIFLMMF